MDRIKAMRHQQGFTIVELLIVIVVIGILAAITVVAYNGIQDRAHNVQVQSDINSVAKHVELYAAKHGTYPSTGGLGASRSDVNCAHGTRTADWIPSLDSTVTLPQSADRPTGIGDNGGCYLYASNGSSYVISAWNMVAGDPQNSNLYRRLGFREISITDQFYYCNHGNIGGNPGGVYNINADYYKHSYTISNITSCNETPPAGA